jgi:hypothetical protein
MIVTIYHIRVVAARLKDSKHLRLYRQITIAADGTLYYSPNIEQHWEPQTS